MVTKRAKGEYSPPERPELLHSKEGPHVNEMYALLAFNFLFQAQHSLTPQRQAVEEDSNQEESPELMKGVGRSPKGR